MASTAYGGSSQLTDLLNSRTAYFNKHKFDITGTRDLTGSIKEELDRLASDPSILMPTTVLFVEIPTNPDMKVPNS
jgi:cystathionine beta-lyase/cystathionine gamma-synthase